MAKLQLYFQDLSEASKREIIKQLKEELKDDIKIAVDNNSTTDKEWLENEIIDDYINRHNLPNEFKIES